MLTEFEVRLANVLGARLAPPFIGRVEVVPDAAAGPGPTMSVGVTSVVPLADDFRSIRREILPEQTQFSRVVRLQCDVEVDVAAEPSQGRAQELLGIDQLIFLLDDGEFRDGTALVEPGDQGFRLDSLEIAETTPNQMRLTATGLFWPVGEPAEDGVAIQEALIRQAMQPIRLEPNLSQVVAGSPPSALTLVIGTAGLRLSADQTAPLAFGAVAVALRGQGGQPGTGTLAGGVAGPDGQRLIDVVDGLAPLTYTPPAAPTRETIVVSSFGQDGGGNQRIGLDLARFELDVRAGS